MRSLIHDRISDVCRFSVREGLFAPLFGSPNMRTAAILGRSPRERHEVYEFMRKAYDVRSKLVHGKKAKLIAVRGRQINFDEALGRLHSYTRELLRRAFEILEIAPIGVNRKGWLVDLLDMSLVRGDILGSLHAYLDHQVEGRKLIEDFHRVTHERSQGLAMWRAPRH
jgi:hypothetical protein